MAKKQNLSYQKIEESLEIFKQQIVPADEVGYCVLKAFGKSDADIRRYREGKGVLTTYKGLLIKGLFCYKTEASLSMTSGLEEMKQDPKVVKANPKIIAVSDGNSILAYDMREHESYENPLSRLYCDFAFFYPLCGVEHFVSVDESPADVKAAEKLAKLHDEIRAYNEFSSKSELHDLNIFIARLLFCFFAEDTGIFEENLFTGSIVRYTKEDGSDLADYLNAAFNVMDVRERNADTMKIITQFPYVNGGLFSKHIQIPRMSFKARKIIIDCGELSWQDINPDIFGSMIQAVVDPEIRANQGMHYTSVPNIMKVISPLFLDDLRAEYQKLQDAFDQKKRLMEIGMLNRLQFYAEVKPIHKLCKKLLERMSKMKFFDPACGSGNFLIITYKMLRLLEMDILRLMRRIIPEFDFLGNSYITISQFYGIELLDFPHEIAMLSLWLAQHQMDKKLHDDFGVNTRALPLHNITQIVCGNACCLDWNVICPHEKDDEVFIFGNPPYLGSRLQDEIQKEDMKIVFKDNYKSLDYIAIWFYLASQYIKHSKSKAAFVSTNSISQGEQVGLIWGRLISVIQISFAYTSFKWTNNAKYNAGVTVVIIGIVPNETQNVNKYIYSNSSAKVVRSINPYLYEGPFAMMERHSSPICKGVPLIRFGAMANDKGNLILDIFEKKDLLMKYPELEPYVKKFVGSQEFINGKERWCIYLPDNKVEEFSNIPEIKERFDNVYAHRINSSEKSTVALAEHPNRFYFSAYKETAAIIIPRVSSERREYIPIGYLDKGTVISDSAFAIYDAEPWLFGILTSKMHMAWVRTVGGKLKTDYRYSAQLCYNTFPFPKISEEKRAVLTAAAENVLLSRADYPEKTLADLYDPDKMPQNLRDAHNKLDDVVDSCFPGYPFASDEERLECLFRLYEKITAE